MKWFRITSPGWQIVIVLALVIFLGWESMPVPGPDGRVVGELYDHPLFKLSQGQTISVFLSTQGPDSDEVTIVTRARILRLRTDEPIRVLQWLSVSTPYLFNRLPWGLQHRITGGPVVEVSVTQEELKRLREIRKEEVGYIFHGI